MTEEHQLRISWDDLKYISLECKNCNIEITLDISKDALLKADWPSRELHCSFCTIPFDSQIKSALGRYADWYSRIKESGHTVYFRVKKSSA